MRPEGSRAVKVPGATDELLDIQRGKPEVHLLTRRQPANVSEIAIILPGLKRPNENVEHGGAPRNAMKVAKPTCRDNEKNIVGRSVPCPSTAPYMSDADRFVIR
jgi:hypothetical protein